MINETITIASNFTVNLTELMSFANLSNFTPGLMNLASEAPKHSANINPSLVITLVGGLVALVFGFVIRDEIKSRKEGICQDCNQELRLLKCADKKCLIRICEPCNLKDGNNPILNICGICSKYVCKQHYGTTHFHKSMGILFNVARGIIDKAEVIKIEPELLPIEYYGENKEIAYMIEPKTSKGMIYGQTKEERDLLANTLLKLKGEGYSLKGYIYDFYILEKQGNILPTPLSNDGDVEITLKVPRVLPPDQNNSPLLESYDFEEMDPPAKIDWGK